MLLFSKVIGRTWLIRCKICLVVGPFVVDESCLFLVNIILVNSSIRQEIMKIKYANNKGV